MRDDLLEAQAAVDWAVAQIPVLEQRFMAYQRRGPYMIEMEPDPKKTGDVLMVAYSLGPHDMLIDAETGVIINSIRSSLDLLAAALARRNGVNPTSKMHFPILKKRVDFLRATENIKKKKWLSQGEMATIKALRPYQRGNKPLYVLHQLDITRKHVRLVEIKPTPQGVQMPTWLPGTKQEWRSLKNKSILLRFPPGTDFRPTKDNCQIALQISFNEPRLGLKHTPVFPALRHFADLAANIIAMFDRP